MSHSTGDRFEYIKQPHIIMLLLVVLCAIGFAVYSGVNRVQDINRIATLDTYDACREFIDDEPLCRFAAASEQDTQENYVITSTASNGDATEISTIEIETADRMKSTTFDGPKEIEAFVVIDAASYVKDYADGLWALYEDPEFVASDPVAEIYDFSSAQAASTVELRDNYHPEGTELCGGLTCYKYRISAADETSITSYIWFDDTDFLLRRHMTISEGVTTTNQFDYRTVSITAPSPVKTVTEEEFDAFLEQQ